MNCEIIHSTINFLKILTMCTVLMHQTLDSLHLQWPLHRRGNPPLRTRWNAQKIMLGVEPALWSSVTGHVKDTKVLFGVLSADPKLLSTVNAKHSHFHLYRRDWITYYTKLCNPAATRQCRAVQFRYSFPTAANNMVELSFWDLECAMIHTIS